MYRVNFFLLILIFFGIFYSNVYSFDVDGFKNGMSQKELRENLNDWKFDKIEERDNFIRAWDIPDSGAKRWYVFTFCNTKLNSVQKDIKPSMKNFILLFQKLTSIHGKPIDSHVEMSIDSIGETNSISFHWANGKDLITLSYHVFPNNDQLAVRYENDSKCSK